MLSGARKTLLCAVGVAAILAWSAACDRLDEEDLGGGAGAQLVAQSVTPTSVNSDVSPSTDPNTGSTPPADDIVTVTVQNTATLGGGDDLVVTSYSIDCLNDSLDVTGSPLTLILAAGATTDVDVVLADGDFKQTNQAALLAIGMDACRISLQGENISGDPVLSNSVAVNVTFADI